LRKLAIVNISDVIKVKVKNEVESKSLPNHSINIAQQASYRDLQ